MRELPGVQGGRCTASTLVVLAATLAICLVSSGCPGPTASAVLVRVSLDGAHPPVTGLLVEYKIGDGSLQTDLFGPDAGKADVEFPASLALRFLDGRSGKMGVCVSALVDGGPARWRTGCGEAVLQSGTVAKVLIGLDATADGGADAAVDPTRTIWLRFEEPAGAKTFSDSSGNQNNGACASCPTAGAAGHAGSAVAFDGTDQTAVIVPHGQSLDLPSAFTVAAWVTADSFVFYGTLLIKSSGRSWDNGFGILWLGDPATNQGTLCAFVGPWLTDDPGTRVCGAFGTTADFRHVAAVYDGQILRLFLDGTQIGSNPIPPTNLQNTADLRIGSSVLGEYPWHGRVDELSLWNRALTPQEIAALARE